jgi:hypothetical protein
MKKLLTLLILISAANIQTAQGQNITAPDLSFELKNLDSLSEVMIAKELEKYTVQPSIAEQKEILNAVLDHDTAFDRRYMFFGVLASYFTDAFDVELRKKYNLLIQQNIDSSNWEWVSVPEDTGEISIFNNEYDMGGEYAFRCLDFNSDQVTDMILFNQVYFGPSPGLVFYGRQGDLYKYLFDCSGGIYSFEKKNNKIYLRFVVYIIESSETEILANMVFDLNTGNAGIESKIYYASQTEIPEKQDAPASFVVSDSVYLRTAPKKNDKINKDALFYDGKYIYAQETGTLFGNVVAVFPENAGGYVLASTKKWAFVIFDSKTPFLRSSLYHGLDNNYYDRDRQVTIQCVIPMQYWCGWIEKKYIRMK